jgi:hypothetical protein
MPKIKFVVLQRKSIISRYSYTSDVLLWCRINNGGSYTDTVGKKGDKSLHFLLSFALDLNCSKIESLCENAFVM